METHYRLEIGPGAECRAGAPGIVARVTSGLLHRPVAHHSALGRTAALALAALLGSGLPLPAGAAGEAPVAGVAERVVGREELIGRLVPITGDPIAVRSVDLRVEFRRNSADLTEGAIRQLRELGEALVSEALRDAPLGVYGHTDTSGPADFNLDLSQRRAQAVATEEVSRTPPARMR